jgi:hypothetical protein
VTPPDVPRPDQGWGPPHGSPSYPPVPEPRTTYGTPQYGSWDADGNWTQPQYGEQPLGVGGPAARTNPMAIWGLVCAFLFAPLGLIFSVIGLNQIPRRRERGRGLAVAGLVVSLVVLAAGALVLTMVAEEVGNQLAADAVSPDPAPGKNAPEAALQGTPPAAPAPASVLEACTTMMPVLIGAEDQMAAADTEAAAMQVVADMRAAIVWAEAAPDPTFQQHLQVLADDLQALVDAVGDREPPAGIQATLEDHSFVVGKDCGLAGWTD